MHVTTVITGDRQSAVIVFTHWGRDKMAAISQTTFFKCIFLNEIAWISLKISLEFVPKVRINNIAALVQIMAWRRPGDKPLPEPMMNSLLTHICVARPQWVNQLVGAGYSWRCRSISYLLMPCLLMSKVHEKPCHWRISPCTQWPPYWQTTISSAFSWMKMTELRFKFHWNLFQWVQLTISQHWFR